MYIDQSDTSLTVASVKNDYTARRERKSWASHELGSSELQAHGESLLPNLGLVQRSAIFLMRGPASNRIIFSISRKLAMTVDVDLLIVGGLLLRITGVQMYRGCRESRGSYRSGSCHEPSQSLGDRTTQKGSWIPPI